MTAMLVILGCVVAGILLWVIRWRRTPLGVAIVVVAESNEVAMSASAVNWDRWRTHLCVLTSVAESDGKGDPMFGTNVTVGKRTLKVGVFDLNGNPAVVDKNVLAFEVVDASNASCTVVAISQDPAIDAAHEFRCDVYAGPGPFPKIDTVRVTGDADLGEGVVPIVGFFSVATLGPSAQHFAVTEVGEEIPL
jgi:hypothetical protein